MFSTVVSYDTGGARLGEMPADCRTDPPGPANNDGHTALHAVKSHGAVLNHRRFVTGLPPSESGWSGSPHRQFRNDSSSIVRCGGYCTVGGRGLRGRERLVLRLPSQHVLKKPLRGLRWRDAKNHGQNLFQSPVDAESFAALALSFITAHEPLVKGFNDGIGVNTAQV